MTQRKNEVVIVGAARTPIGKHGGFYNTVSAEDLAVLAVEEALRRSGIDLNRVKIDQVIAGMIYIDSRNQQIYLPRNVATRVAQKFGDSDNLYVAPGKTALRICGTGFQTIADAYDLITADPHHKLDCVISFGTENMSRTNLIHQGRRKRENVWEFEDAPLRDYLLEGFNHYQFETLMPKTAEKYGALTGVTAEDCYEFSVLSHERAKNAQLNQWNRLADSGDKNFMRGIFTVDTVDEAGVPLVTWRDEGVRYDVSVSELRQLRPLIQKNGLVNAGTASQISDGAAAMVLMDRAAADRQNIPYLARVSGYHFATVDPTIMGQGPVPAIRGLMTKLKLEMGDVDLFEINEAFAAQYLGVEKELELPREFTNVNGGAIAVGHNIAATGLRITVDLMYELIRRGAKTGIASACIGGGQGGAVCVEIL
ncbi:MAG: thiolase family protein [FCB group bacterium]|nr:thiolase family protein [FCB group bacterium]